MVNSIGERIDLNDKEGLLFTNPSGLGLTYDVSQADLEGGFYKRTKVEYPSQTIVGDLIILGDSYSKYREFVNWINKGRDLSFIYKPYGNVEYQVDVEIEFRTSPEREPGGMECKSDRYRKGEATDTLLQFRDMICIIRTEKAAHRSEQILIVGDVYRMVLVDLEGIPFEVESCFQRNPGSGIQP